MTECDALRALTDFDAKVAVQWPEVAHAEESGHLRLEPIDLRLVRPNHDEVINIDSDEQQVATGAPC